MTYLIHPPPSKLLKNTKNRLRSGPCSSSITISMNSHTSKSILAAAVIGLGFSQAADAQVAILDLRTPWVPVNTSGGVGTSWIKNNIYIPGGSTVNATLTITGLGNGTIVGGSVPLVLKGVDTANPWLTYTLAFDDGTGPVAFPNFFLTAFDIDGEGGKDLREFWGYKNTSAPIVEPPALGNPTNIQAATFTGGPVDMANYTTFAPKVSASGINAPSGDQLNIGSVQAPWAVYNQYGSLTSGEFFYGFTGSSGGTPFERQVFMTGLQAPEPGTAAGSLVVGSAMIGMASRRRRK